MTQARKGHERGISGRTKAGRMTSAWLATLLVHGTGLTAGTIPFSCEEPLKRAWSNEVLSFEVRVPRDLRDPASMYVTDESGAVVPAQVSDVRFQEELREIPLTVSLVADLQPWQKRSWTLHAGETARPAVPATDLKAQEEKDSYVLSNARLAVRVPRGRHAFKVPAAAAEAPAPLLGVRGPSGTWIGRGWLESPKRVTGYTADLTHDGPIFKRVRTVYEFEGGRYVCTVTLRTGEDVVHVRDEFDLGEPAAERDSSFCFSLKDGLAPDTVRWYGRCFGPRCNVRETAPNTNTEAEFPIDYSRPERLLRLHGLFVWWPEAASYWGAYRAGDAASDLVAVFPERPGRWRNPAAVFLETGPDHELLMRFPLRQPIQDWSVDGVNYASPYWTGSVSPDVPRTLGIREWGLLVTTAAGAVSPQADIAGSGIRQAWTRYGQNPLDKIKNWTLRWADPGAAAFPRGAVTAAELPAVRERAARQPALKAMLGSPQHRLFTYLVRPDSTNAVRLIRGEAGGDTNWMGLLPRLRYAIRCYLDTQGDLGSSTFMHHGNFHIAQAAPLYDVAMSAPEMTAEERREAMALYAFCLHKLSDPDWLAYGTGFHLGNPNMPTTSLSLIGAGAALVPEHPMASEWMMRSLSSTLTMLRDYVAPGGAWRECPHYQMDASMVGVIQSADLMKNAGMMDLYRNPSFKATMLYHLQLITPVDPRFGIRLMPAIGNTGHEPTSLYGRMAAGTADSDAEYSRWMQWGWKAVGAPYLYPNDATRCNEDLPAAPPDLSSRHFPGFGAVMRAHAGDADETYAVFRMGYQHEHYEPGDQGNVLFYARGTPLVLDFGSIYQPPMKYPWLHNRVAFDREVDGAIGEIVEAGFLQAADAALGRLTVDRLETWPEDPWTRTPPNTPPPSRSIAPVTWTRQVMLAKHEQAAGPHYLLLRDGFQGDGAEFSEFTLWCLAHGVEPGARTAEYKGQLGMNLTVTLLDPDPPEFSTGQYGHKFLSGATAPYWKKVNGTNRFEEVQHFIRVKRTDRQGYFAVLYPHRPGEAVPAFEPWAGGAGTTATIGEERHTAVCAEHPGVFSEGGVTFEGQRALVREGKGRLVLALLAGQSLQAGGYHLTAAGPVAVTVDGGRISGEANLTQAGEIALGLPAGATVRSAVMTTDGKDTELAMSVEGQAVRLSLPAGPCAFRLD